MDLEHLADDDEWLVERFREQFPKEIDAICKLAPLQKRDSALIDRLLLRLFNIVGTYGRRLSDTEDYSGRVLQTIRSAEAAAQHFGSVVDGVMKIDITHIEQILFCARKLYPRFFGKQEGMNFYRSLCELQAIMMVLPVAMKLGTGIFNQHRGRGRPPSPYTQAALGLIDAWEFYTAERSSWSTGWIIKRVPTPKKRDVQRPEGGQPRYETKQSSTEFVRLGLRMIKPAISDSEVFTAIKKALKVRDQLSELTEATQKEPWFRLLTGESSD